MAFPAIALRFAGQAVAQHSRLQLEDDEEEFLKAKCRDKSGSIRILIELLAKGIDW
jgi:hypothetical protein